MAGKDNEAVETADDTSAKKSAVRFSMIEIREYPIVVGDNPAIMTGTPITIDWEHVDEIDCTVDDFEASKPPPRTMLEIRLPAKNRDDILKAQGFSLKERQIGMKVANTTRGQRRRTLELMKLSRAQEAIERAKRATLNATIHRARKRKERELLRQWKPKSESNSQNSSEFTADMATADMELEK